MDRLSLLFVPMGRQCPFQEEWWGGSNEQEAEIVGEGPFYFCCLGPNCVVALDARVLIKSVSLRLSDVSKKVLRRDIKLMQAIGRFHGLVRGFIEKIDVIQIGQVKSDASVYKQSLSDIAQSLMCITGKLRHYRDQEAVLEIAESVTRYLEENNEDETIESLRFTSTFKDVLSRLLFQLQKQVQHLHAHVQMEAQSDAEFINEIAPVLAQAMALITG